MHLGLFGMDVMIDRQLALLVDQKYNNGLPENLKDNQSSKSVIQHGFKAIQISVSAWTAEALKLTMPASVFSERLLNVIQG